MAGTMDTTASSVMSAELMGSNQQILLTLCGNLSDRFTTHFGECILDYRNSRRGVEILRITKLRSGIFYDRTEVGGKTVNNEEYIVCRSQGCSNRIRRITTGNRVNGAIGGGIFGGLIGGLIGGPIGAIAVSLMTAGAGASQQKYCSICLSKMEEEDDSDG